MAKINPFEIERILNIPFDSEEEYDDLSDDETFNMPVSFNFTFNISIHYN